MLKGAYLWHAVVTGAVIICVQRDAPKHIGEASERCGIGMGIGFARCLIVVMSKNSCAQLAFV